MRTTDGARPRALGLLAAVAGTAALGVAVLAAAGAHVCHHHVLAHAHAALAGGISGVALPVPDPEDAEGLCPILVYAAGLAAGLCLLALLALVRACSRNTALLAATARLVAAQRLAPLAAAVGLAGAVPLGAILALDGGLGGAPAVAAFAALVAGALLTALALAGAAQVVLALAERLVVALTAVLRLLSPGADTRWAIVADPLLVPAGVGLARRRPSRAPPVRR
jgi:hypothetical protein